MTNKRRKKRTYYCFPAQALLDQFEEHTWANTIAEQLGTTRSTIQRWRSEPALLSPYQADGFAIKLGKHPSQIWTNWFDLPEYTEQQRKEILNPCQPTNATANETESSQPDTEHGDSTSPPSTSTSSSTTTTVKLSRSSNTAISTAASISARRTSSRK